MLAFGILTLSAGILALAWPGRTVVILAVLFGVQLVVAGIFGFVAAWRPTTRLARPGCCWPYWGVLSFIVGLYALRHILVTIATLALLPGSFWIVNGAIESYRVVAPSDARPRLDDLHGAAQRGRRRGGARRPGGSPR